MRRAITIFAVLVLVTGAAFAQEKPAVTGDDELEKVKGKYQETWVHPDADISKYDKIYAWDAVYQFREGGETKSSMTSTMLKGGSDRYAVAPEDQKQFEELVSEAILKELGKSKKFELVEELGPDTLLVRGVFLDIISRVPPSLTGTANFHLADLGEATLVFELIDAETGVIQARVAERRTIEPPGQMNRVSASPTTSATVLNDVKRWAANVGQELRKGLDKAKKKAE
ncbi:MAG: DUF3313 domain-containing protein [bacterium]|nr:DUF3313 domain-containing protein [bacterium]